MQGITWETYLERIIDVNKVRVNALIKTDYMICLFPNWARLSIWPTFWYK